MSNYQRHLLKISFIKYHEKALYYNQDDYKKAIWYYEQAFEI